MCRRVVVCAFVLGLAGCGKREVCDPGMGIQFAPVADVWKPYQELMPPSATMCGHIALFGKPNERALNIDFATDDNPVAGMMKHLESKGFQRAAASTDNPDTQSIRFTRGAETVRATTFRDKGRVRAVVEVEDAACTQERGPDGAACRGNEIVLCKPGTSMVASVKEKCAGSCKASAASPAACQ